MSVILIIGTIVMVYTAYYQVMKSTNIITFDTKSVIDNVTIGNDNIAILTKACDGIQELYIYNMNRGIISHKLSLNVGTQ